MAGRSAGTASVVSGAAAGSALATVGGGSAADCSAFGLTLGAGDSDRASPCRSECSGIVAATLAGRCGGAAAPPIFPQFIPTRVRINAVLAIPPTITRQSLYGPLRCRHRPPTNFVRPADRGKGGRSSFSQMCSYSRSCGCQGRRVERRFALGAGDGAPCEVAPAQAKTSPAARADDREWIIRRFACNFTRHGQGGGNGMEVEICIELRPAGPRQAGNPAFEHLPVAGRNALHHAARRRGGLESPH